MKPRSACPLALVLIGIAGVAIASGPAAAEELTFHYTFAAPLWESAPFTPGYEIPSIAGTRTLGQAGEPLLPIGAARILLPPGEEIVSVRVVPEAVAEVSAHLPAPAQKEYPLSFEGPIAPTLPKAAIYSSDALFPTEAGALASVQIYRGHRIAYLDLFPVRVRPASRQAEFVSGLRVEITTAPDENARARSATTFRGDDATRAWLAHNTDNPQMADRYAEAQARGLLPRPVHAVDPLRGGPQAGRSLVNPADTYLHVIITSQALVPIFAPLAADRTAKGLPSTIVTVNDIYASYTGRDNQERIRNFILDAYQNWETEYIFFAGDIDVIPNRDCYCYVIDEGTPMETNSLCCELYYGGLDGTWNDDNDDRWGEVEEADLVPDIHVGRVCADNATEAQNYITKVLRYERQPVVNEVESASFYGEYLWEGTYGDWYMEEIRLGASTWGYTTAGVPLDWNTTTYYEETGSWSGTNFINKMSSGCHMAHHLGHANETYDVKVYVSDVPSFTANGITHTYNFGYSQGCYAGDFDETDCIHEEFLNSPTGFVAWIGNTRYGFGVHYTTNGSSQYYHRQFVDALFGEGLNELAAANDDSRTDNVPYIAYESNRWVHYEVTAFGDPSMPIWTARPRTPQLDHAGVFVLGMTSYDVTVSAQGQPVAGARVCLWDEAGTCYGFGVTNAAGDVTIGVAPGYPGTMHMVVSDADLLVTETTFPIVPNGPYIVIDSHRIDDSIGGNDDGDCDAGETIDLYVDLCNVWNAPIAGVTATLSCASPEAAILDGTAFYGTIPGGATVGGQAGDHFTFHIDGGCPDQQALPFTLEIRDAGTGLWTGSFTYTADASALAIVTLEVDDSAGGNGNHCLDPGESALVTVRLDNSGHRDATTVAGTLFSGGSGLVVTQAHGTAPEVPIGGQAVLAPSFEVTLEPWAPSPGIVNCRLHVTADWDLVVDLAAQIGIGGFADDMEAGEGAWSHQIVTPGFVDQWHLSTQRNHTAGGSFSWKFGDTGSGSYANLADGALATEEVEIAETTVLTFWHWIQAEVSSAYPGRCYDGGLVEMSLDGGPWSRIDPEGGYPYTIRAGGTPGPFPADTPVFSGSHGWQQETFTIEGAAGMARFRFRFGSDGADALEGWYIDDVEIHSWPPASAVPEPGRELVLRPVLLANRPNPFTPQTRIAFQLPGQGDVRLCVLDLQGRVVRTLVDGPLAAGHYDVIWDGADGGGRPQPAGIYFYRLEDGATSQVRKMTLLR
jgi:hypothetical protein